MFPVEKRGVGGDGGIIGTTHTRWEELGRGGGHGGPKRGKKTDRDSHVIAGREGQSGPIGRIDGIAMEPMAD